MKTIFAILLLTSLITVSAQNVPTNSALTIVNRALKAMGTVQKIGTINNIQLDGYGHRYLLEQSERYEGPYISSQINFKLTINLKDTIGQLRQNEKLYTFQNNATYLVDGNRIAMKMQGSIMACPQEQLVTDDVHLNPLWLFQKALSSPSLKSLSDTIVQDVTHQRIQFLWNTFPVTIAVNSNTYLPTMVEIQKPYSDNYLEVWGDIKKVIFYSFWDLFDNGVHYPRQKDVYFNGKLYESTLITDLRFNQPVSPDSLRIPAQVKLDIANINQSNRRNIQRMLDARSEIAPNIWLIPGFCNSTIVQHNNELTIIESPNTSLNMEMIFEQAERLFPKATIKQVVTTSDAWLHLGGVRASANRVPLIALSENKDIVQALLMANYKTVPDAWQRRADKNPTVKYIDQRTIIGNGTNRMELIPYRTEAGERMMMVYFPEHKLLYASDLLQPDNWQKHYSLEVIEAIQRENLVVDTIYAMHMRPITYATLLKQMENYLSN